jgi:hypothetical protein
MKAYFWHFDGNMGFEALQTSGQITEMPHFSKYFII